MDRAIELENVEIRENPKGFLRRNAGEGLNAATRREVRGALRRLESDD